MSNLTGRVVPYDQLYTLQQYFEAGTITSTNAAVGLFTRSAKSIWHMGFVLLSVPGAEFGFQRFYRFKSGTFYDLAGVCES
jgi:hypothetical protein